MVREKIFAGEYMGLERAWWADKKIRVLFREGNETRMMAISMEHVTGELHGSQ